MNIQLITENYIKENSPVTDNVDPKELGPHVQSAQIMYLRPILGLPFYNSILEKFNDQTLNADEIELVQGYIQPFLLYKSLQLALPFFQWNFRNKGLIQNLDDNGQPAGFGEFKFVLNEVKGRSDVNERLLKNYLVDNGDLFPFYGTPFSPAECKGNVDASQGLIFY